MTPLLYHPLFRPLAGAALLALVLTPRSGEAEILSPGPERLNAQVDFDGNGLLDYDEIIFALAHKLTGEGDLLGQKAKGKAPKAAVPAKLPTKVKDAWQTIEEVALPSGGHGHEYALGAINPRKLGLEKLLLPAETDEARKHQRYFKEWDYKIRRSVDDLEKPIEDAYAQGALFSYAQDYNRNESQWAARGVISLGYSIVENPDYVGPLGDAKGVFSDPTTDPQRRSETAFLHSVTYKANVAFDKVTTGGSDREEVDTLDFSGSAAFVWQLPANLTGVRHLGAELAGHYATDFNGEKGIYAATLEVTPTTGLPGNGVFKWLGEYHNRFNESNYLLAFRWSVSLHGEVGTVADANAEPALLNYDSFARIGGKANLEVLIFPDAFNNRLTLDVSYTHREALESKVPDTHLFSAALQYVFPIGSGLYSRTAKKGEVPYRTERDQVWTLRLEYTNGVTPLVAEDDNHLLVGLGIAF